MATNRFGTLFTITTWGESHGKAIGVVVDGCPAGLALSEADINAALAKRAPGRNPYTSPRREPDIAEILAGVFDGKTTGAPISMMIMNQDSDSSRYEPTKHLLKPGHANYTYTQKYGVFDYRGGGRASARETACRVAAGAVADKLLASVGIRVVSYIRSIGAIDIDLTRFHDHEIEERLLESTLCCPDKLAEAQMINVIEQAKQQGDSVGGIVEFKVLNMKAGLGDPVYEKLEANLAKAMMSLPASKGFEMGDGFLSARLTGSEHNDAFIALEGQPTLTNHGGGTLGGISTGMPLVGRVAFKPTSSIRIAQQTVDLEGNPALFELPEGSRHDPCVAIRAVPVVAAMCSLVLADALLLNRCARLTEMA